MDIAELFEKTHCPINESDLIPVKVLKDKKASNDLKKKISCKLPTYSEIEIFANMLEEKIDHFYINLKGFLSVVCYFRNATFIEIFELSEKFISDFKIKDRIEENDLRFKKALRNNSFLSLFNYMDSKIRLLIYKKLFSRIPDNEKFDIFLKIYSHSEYGFNDISRDLILEIAKYKNTNNYKLKKKLKNNIDGKGYITIYRGTTNKSTPVNKAYSWTTNICVASFFATRFNSEGCIYQGKIHYKDIIAYISNKECEVLTLPEKVVDVKIMDMISTKDILENKNIFDLYWEHTHDIKTDLFDNPKGIHGVDHAKRVLLLTIILCKYESISGEDRDILITAAKYHDIGRTHDNHCEIHGILSFNKMKNLELIFNHLVDDDTLQYIIDNHCVQDDIGIGNIYNYNIKDKYRAVKLLQILKDADNLDRVRLHDTEIRYLRSATAKKLPLVANEIYRENIPFN